MIKCPKCGLKRTLNLHTDVTSNNRVRRRRKCADCGYRFTTYEVYEEDITSDIAFKQAKRGPKGDRSRSKNSL